MILLGPKTRYKWSYNPYNYGYTSSWPFSKNGYYYITPFATSMNAYLVVATVTLGEVFACQLKKFHSLLELPCWMRGPENLGTFEGNQ